MKKQPDDIHDLDLGNIDELDEISGDEQLALIWCDIHQQYEWHWIERDYIPGTRRRIRYHAERI
jgi:hypothetical protein